MILADFHTHTNFCDGRNTPEQMVQAAIGLGMTKLGVLTHSYTVFDESYCIPATDVKRFQQTVAELKENYRGQIELLCGVEQDRYSTASTAGFDYVLGSVHYVYVNGCYIAVDGNPEKLKQNVQKHFGGDWYAFAELYFQTVADVAEATHPNIIGHFDLVSKYNGDGALFDETHPRYVAAWQAAADRLLTYDIPFEINLGGMWRAGRPEPYPTLTMQRYLAERGARVVLCGDCHSADQLRKGFDEWEAAAVKAGFAPHQWATI